MTFIRQSMAENDVMGTGRPTREVVIVLLLT